MKINSDQQYNQLLGEYNTLNQNSHRDATQEARFNELRQSIGAWEGSSSFKGTPVINSRDNVAGAPASVR